MLANTDGSLMLNLTDVIVSVDVGKVKFVIGALLRKIYWICFPVFLVNTTYFVSSHICTVFDAVAKRESVR